MAWFERRQRGLNPQKRKEIPKGLWIKCDKCDAMLYNAELERDANVCSKCDYHFKIGYEQYISLVMDPDTFIEEVADHAMMLILATFRRLLVQDRMSRDGRWEEGSIKIKNL